MKTKNRLIVFWMALLLMLSLSAGELFAATYTSTQAGDWNDAATWGGGGFPNNIADVVNVGHNVSINGNFNVATITVTAGTLSFDGAIRTLTTNTALNVNGGTFDASGTNTLVFNGSFNDGGGTITTDASTNITISGASAQLSLPADVDDMNNFVLNRANGMVLEANETIKGSLTLTNGALNYAGFTLTIEGNLSRTSGTFASSNASGTIVLTGTGSTSSLSNSYGTFQDLEIDRTVTLGGNLTVASRLILSDEGVFDISGRELILNGDFTQHASATFTASLTSDLKFENVGAFSLPTAFTSFGGNITIDRPNAITMAADLLIEGDLTLRIGTWAMATFTLEVQGDLTRVGGTFTSTSSTLKLTGSGTQTNFGSGFFTSGPHSLYLDRNVTTITNLTVDGTLTLASGTFDIQNYTLTFTGGSIVVNTGAIDATDAASTVIITPDNSLTLPSGTFLNNIVQDLTLGDVAFTTTLGGNLTVNGILTVGVDGSAITTFSIGANSLTINENFDPGTNDILTANTSGATVVFASTMNSPLLLNSANLTGTAFYNLTNSVDITLTGNLTISGALSLVANTIDIQANTFNLNGTLSVTAGDLDVDAGTFAMGGASTTDFTIPAGLFAGSVNIWSITRDANVIMSGNITMVAATGALTLDMTGKTFQLNGNTLAFAGAGTITTTAGTITANNSSTLSAVGILAIDGAGNIEAASFTSSTVGNLTLGGAQSLTGDLTVNGTLTLTANLTVGANHLTFNNLSSGAGNLVTAATSDLTVGIGSTSTSAISIPASVALLDDLTINVASANTVTLTGDLDCDNGITLTSGTLKIGTGQTLTLSAGTIARTNGNFYSADAAGGTFQMDPAGALPAGLVCYNFTVGAAVAVTTSGNFTVNVLDIGTNGATLNISDDHLTLNAAPTLAGGTLTVNANSSLTLNNVGVLTLPVSVTTLKNFTINNTGSTITLAADLAIGATSGDALNLIAGTLDLSTFDLTLNRAFNYTAGAITANAATSAVVIGANGPATLNASAFTANTIEDLTLGRDVTLSGNLISGQSGTGDLDLGGNTLTLNGNTLTVNNTVTNVDIDATATGSKVVVNLTAAGAATALGKNSQFVSNQVYDLDITAAQTLTLAAGTILEITNLLNANTNGVLDFGTNASTVKIYKQPTSWGAPTTAIANSTLHILGSSAGNITFPATAETYLLLVVNRTANDGGLALDAAAGVTVSGLTLTDGRITIPTGNTLTVGNGGAAISGFSIGSGGSFDNTQGTLLFNTSSAVSPGANFSSIYNLTLTSTGGFNLGADFEVEGLLTVAAGNFNIGANRLTLNATPTENNLLIGGATSELVLDEAAAQYTLGTALTTLDYLDLNSSNGLLLAANLTVDNELRLSNGTLTDGGFTIDMQGDNFIVTNGDITATGLFSVTTSSNKLEFPAGLTLENVTLNRATGLDLNGDLIIEGTLTLTSGDFNVLANTLTLENVMAGTISNLKTVPASSMAFTGANAATIVLPTTVIELENFTLNMTNAAGIVQLNVIGLKVNGDMALTDGDIDIPSTATLEYAGDNLTRTSGQIDAAAGTFTISGAGGTLDFPSGMTPYDMIINRSSGISLQGNLAIPAGGSLTLTSGDLDLNGDNIITLDATAELDESAGNTIINSGDENSTGHITITTAGSPTAGTDIGGLGVVFSNMAGAFGNTVIKRYHHPITPGDEQAITRHFEIDATTNNEADVTFFYDDTELNGLTEANLGAMSAEFNTTAGPWQLYGDAVLNTSSNSITIADVTGFDNATTADSKYWTIGTPTIVSISELENGLAVTPLVASRTDQAILGARLTSTNDNAVEQIVFDFAPALTGQLANFKLWKSADDDFSTSEDNEQIGTTVASALSSVTFTLATNENLFANSGLNLFLTADINSAVTIATAGLTSVTLDATKITISQGVVEEGSVITGPYSFIPGIMIAAIYNNGIVDNPIIVGSEDNALMGVGIKSTSNTTFTGLRFTMSSDPTDKFENFAIYISSDNIFDDGDVAVNSTVTMDTEGVAFAFTANQNLSTTEKYYYLVATEVKSSVTAGTANITPSLVEGDITATPTVAGVIDADNVWTGETFYFDNLTISATTTGVLPNAGNITKGYANQTLYGFKLQPDLNSTTSDFTGVKVKFVLKAGLDEDRLSNFRLWADANMNGLPDAGESISNGVVTVGVDELFVTFGTAAGLVFSQPQTIDDEKYYIVTASVNSAANENGTVKGSILRNEDILMASPAKVSSSAPYQGNLRTVKTAGTATKLAMTISDNPVVTGTNFSVTVEMQDANGTPVKASSGNGGFNLTSNKTLTGAPVAGSISDGQTFATLTAQQFSEANGATGGSLTATSTSSLTAASLTGITILSSVVGETQESAILTPINITGTSAQIQITGWTIGTSDRRILVIREGRVPKPPVNGVDYVVNTNLASINDVGVGQTAPGSVVVYDGATVNASVINIRGLMPGKTYYLQAYGYNGTGTLTNYLTASSTNNPKSFTTVTPTAPSDGFTTNTDSTNAQPIPTNSDVRANLTSTYKVDWFIFNVATGQNNLLISLDNLPENYQLELYQNTTPPRLLRTAYGQNLNKEVIIINDVIPGQYLLKVFSEDGDSYSNTYYTVRVNTSATEYLSQAE